MAIILNDNIKTNAGKPLESKYLNSLNSVYTSVYNANMAIPISERYIGLTVNINNCEYWYKDGVNNINLIEKKYSTIIPTGDYVTGGTNLGYFEGYTGVQILPINHLTQNDYDGNYYSLYNNYYRDGSGIIRIGASNDGILRRGYVKRTSPIKSWIWSDYNNVGTGDLTGWSLIDGDISKLIGTFQNSGYPIYYNGTSKFPYNETIWEAGRSYNNSSNLVINTVTGSLTTGDTLTLGARPFAFGQHNNLHFRTITSDTSNIVKVWDDNDSLIHISATTATYNAKNLNATGYNVYSGTTGNTFVFKKIIGSGNTQVISQSNRLIIHSSSEEGGTYNLSSPSTLSIGGILAGTVLTGKNSFQLFEQLLAPLTNPTLTNPSVSIGITINNINYNNENIMPFEIGCVLSSTCLYGCFNAGCICPRYNALSDKRSSGAKGYCYEGQSVSQYVLDGSTCNNFNISGHVVVSGTQTWDVKTCYSQGVQPYDSRGNAYSTPLPEGFTPTSSFTISGILPWYWGLSDSSNVNGTCIASCGCEGKGKKCVGMVLSSPIYIAFNSTSNNYIWFALPTYTSLKTCWYINGTNNGCIGGDGNLFASPYIRTVNSQEGCWTGCNYCVYVSCYKTGTANGAIMSIY